MRKLSLLLLLLSAGDLAASPICSNTSSYSPITGVTHQTAVLVDPSGQQTAMFDLAWGGALVSLRYQNVEYINSSSTLGLVQPILRATNYTPVLAGDDANRGSPMLGVACSQDELWLTSGMTDYDRNRGASTAYVHNNSQWYFDHFSAPYVVSTYAYFVPNPSGIPAYYLKLDQSISNIDGQEAVEFTLDLAAAPATSYGSFRSLPAGCSGSSSSCTAAGAPYLVGGYYNASGSDGLAIATTPSAQWAAGGGVVSVEGDQNGAGNTIHLKKSGWHVAPRSGRLHSNVVMVGSWASAAAYASQACTFAVSVPFLHPTDVFSAAEGGDSALAATIAAAGAATTISITAPPGCSWNAFVESGSASNYLFVTPSIGVGNGSVALNIATNPTNAIRVGNVFVSGQMYPFWQQIGCAYSLDTTSATVPSGGGGGSVSVTAPSGNCSWRATTDASWITITSGVSGSGSGTVNYLVAPNAGGTRSATMIVAGLIFTISQAASAIGTPTGLLATAQGGGIQVGWQPPNGATTYELWRSLNGAAFSPLATSGSSSYYDSNAAPGLMYAYKVRVISPTSSSFSNIDFATTIHFTDDPIITGSTTVSHVHIEELRQAINVVRATAGLGGASYSHPANQGDLIYTADIQELRDRLAEAFSSLGISPPSYDDSSLQPHVTLIKRAHIVQIQDALR